MTYGLAGSNPGQPGHRCRVVMADLVGTAHRPYTHGRRRWLLAVGGVAPAHGTER